MCWRLVSGGLVTKSEKLEDIFRYVEKPRMEQCVSVLIKDFYGSKTNTFGGQARCRRKRNKLLAPLWISGFLRFSLEPHSAQRPVLSISRKHLPM